MHDHEEHCECGCSCGCHENCGCEHEHKDKEGKVLLIAGALFAAGILLSAFGAGVAGSLLHIAAYVLLGLPVLKTAGKNLLKGHIFDENFLMSIATLGAFAIGQIPEAVGVMLFYRVGEYFEHRAAERSRKGIMEAADLRPEVVTLEDGTVIPAAKAKVGDVLIVRPGDRIPLDGRVLTGKSRIDTAPVTGESVPVGVQPGSVLISGCVNGMGLLTMAVEKPLEESMVTRILRSVEQAAASKPRMDRFITRFSRVYTPAVVVAAATTAVIPSLITGDWGYWVYTALSFLVMSCPCALVLSVPLTFFSGIGAGSRQGILFKGGASMEAMTEVKAVAMDKTGTLTRGDFVVQKVEGGEDVLRLCAACEQISSHPIAQSIRKAAAGMVLPAVREAQELAGMGIRAKVDGKQVLCGSRALLESHGITAEPMVGTVVYLAVAGSFRGYLVIGDTLKEESPGAVARLKKLGILPVMLTGDHGTAAHAVARAVGIEKVYASLLPEQKLAVLETLRGSVGKTMFVGDGINDAPVLAGADVGGAMGSGADAAIEAADVVFMTSRTDAIPEAITLARHTRRIAWQNVVFALGIKLAVMVLGLLGYANMWLAVFADSGVAMLCVLNSIRMLYSRK